MNPPNIVILYVANPSLSAAFYAQLLGKPPVESSPTFAMFALDHGMMLGLWGRDGVAPNATAAAGSSELAFTLADNESVKTCHAEWVSKGIPIAQTPTQMDFGYTFVGLDPDEHRLRVFAPAH